MRVMNIIAAAVLVTAAVAATPEAHAQRRGQGTNVVVLDINRVIAESTLGRDMTTKLQGVRNEVGAEAQALQTEARSIDEEGQRVQQATRNLSAEARQNNAQVQALQQRMNQFQQRRVAFEGGLQCTEALALRDLTTQMTPTVRSVMESRGATVVLGREAVQLASPDADITSTVIEQLNQNQATRTANVSRRQVSECQAQQQPAGQ
jgi:Skp family chaperone for outer membrane proteins